MQRRSTFLDSLKEDLVSTLANYISRRAPKSSNSHNWGALNSKYDLPFTLDILDNDPYHRYSNWDGAGYIKHTTNKGTDYYFKMTPLTYERMSLALDTIKAIRTASDVDALKNIINTKILDNAALSSKHLKTHTNHLRKSGLFDFNISKLSDHLFTCLEKVEKAENYHKKNQACLAKTNAG